MGKIQCHQLNIVLPFIDVCTYIHTYIHTYIYIYTHTHMVIKSGKVHNLQPNPKVGYIQKEITRVVCM